MSRTRTLITKGVYKDRHGVAIIVSVNGKPREFRHELDEQGKKLRKYDPRLGPAWYRDERKRVQAREHLKAERIAATTGTFAADVDRYLQTISSPTHRINSHGYLQYWIRAFGTGSRHAITELAVQHAFAAIEKQPSTKNHIRHALIKFFETMNGATGLNPARVLPRARKPHTEARALPYSVIERILTALQPSRAKARLMVMAYTGLPQTLIAKIQPGDLDLRKSEVRVKPRRKGARVAGRTLPLSPAGVEAFREFVRLEAFGPFQNRQLVMTFKHGAKLARVALPEDARPYDLRHSFLTEVYRETGDLKAVSELGMHATLEQTARYAQGAVSERATKAIRAVPRFAATTISGNAGKRRKMKGVVVRSGSQRKTHRKGHLPKRTRS